MPKERKYIQILRAIREKRFPILITGPSGVGKSHAILSAVRTLHLPYVYVDVSQSQICRSLMGGITHIVLYRLQDLENIRHTGNLIVETAMHGIEEKLVGCTHIRMNRPEFKKVQKIQHCKYKERMEAVDVFRFIGRIFYKKLKMIDIENRDGWIHYYGSTVTVDHYIRTDQNKELDATDNAIKSSRKFVVCDESSDLEFPRIPTMQQFVTDDQISSFDEDKIFSSENINKESPNMEIVNEIFSSEERMEHGANNAIKRLIRLTTSTLCPDEAEDIQSFETRKIETLLYANFPHFLHSDDLLLVYDSLSLTGVSEIFLESWIGALLKSRMKDKKVFFSFKAESPGKAVATSWQYKFNDEFDFT